MTVLGTLWHRNQLRFVLCEDFGIDEREHPKIRHDFARVAAFVEDDFARVTYGRFGGRASPYG
jgi:hypothetical protein